MEDQCSPLALPYLFQEEGIEELKHSLLYTTLELENTIVCARDEIAKKDQEILHLNNLLARIVKERDEAIEECSRIGLEKQLLRQQMNLQFLRQQHGGVVEAAAPPSTAGNEDHHTLSSSDSVENNNNNKSNKVVNFAPGKRSSTPQPSPHTSLLAGIDDVADKIMPKMPFPEKGKFLQAVMEAGPLLQTLLLAGPLPEWQHPPPQLNSIDIPPVTISPSSASAASGGGGMGYFSKKRPNTTTTTCESPSPSKYQKFIVNQISPLITNIITC